MKALAKISDKNHTEAKSSLTLFVTINIALCSLGIVIFYLYPWPEKHALFVSLMEWQDAHLVALFIGSFLIAVVFAQTRVTWFEGLLAIAVERIWWIACALFAILSWGALFLYRNHPLSADEASPLFQAKVFLAGKVAGNFPPALRDRLLGEGRDVFFYNVSPANGDVVSVYWPGYAALLAPFTSIGAEWLLNPILSAATLVLLCKIAQRLSRDTKVAGWVVLLTLASPAFTVNGLTFYSMTARLFFNLLFAYLLLEPTNKKVFLAGLVGSIALIMHNPFPHFLFGIPWLLWIVFKRRNPKEMILLAAGYLPGVFIVLVWLRIRHSISTLRVQYGAIEAPKASLSFFEAVSNFVFNIIGNPFNEMGLLNFLGLFKAYLWAVPGLLGLAIYAAWRLRGSEKVRLLSYSLLVTFCGYLFVPFSQGFGWGYRYIHSAWGVLPLIGGLYLASLRKENSILQAFRLLTVISLFLLTPFRFFQVHQFMTDYLSRFECESVNVRHLCFIDKKKPYGGGDYVQNDPFQRDPRLILWSHGKGSDREWVHRTFPTAYPKDSSETIWYFK